MGNEQSGTSHYRTVSNLQKEEGEGEGRIRERGQGDTHMKEYLCAHMQGQCRDTH